MNLQDDLSLYMDRGEVALGKGEYEHAVNLFGLAVKVAHEIEDGEVALCAAMQMLGIGLRLEGDLDNAEMVFVEALQRAPAGSSLVGRIKRDYGMVWMDRATTKGSNEYLPKALELFEESQQGR